MCTLKPYASKAAALSFTSNEMNLHISKLLVAEKNCSVLFSLSLYFSM